MKAKFVGGPYDGLELDHDQINAYCDIGSIPADGGGRRLFVSLPPLERWDDLVSGRVSKEDKAGWGDICMYERKVKSSGVEFHAVAEMA
jgi:hypothetical protein